MALMFQRLARNFAKNGYFPTDAESISRIINALTPAKSGTINLFDPCCGEGSALAEIKHAFGEVNSKPAAYGIEYNSERAWEAKRHLDTVIHADIQDTLFSQRKFSLLFLNPPYGDTVTDSAAASDKEFSGRQRLEKMFYSKTISTLQHGGILVLMIPFTTLDIEFTTWLSRHFDNIRVFMAPEQQFKQIILFGMRSRKTHSDKKQNDALLAIGKGQLPEEIPKCWLDETYDVPASVDNKVKFETFKIDAKQLSQVFSANATLWSTFASDFGHGEETKKPPLTHLSDWHMALLLAAGGITGVVESRDGRQVLIKGGTHKAKKVSTSMETDSETGAMTHTRIATDCFVPKIRGIELTEGVTRGDIIHINN